MLVSEFDANGMISVTFFRNTVILIMRKEVLLWKIKCDGKPIVSDILYSPFNSLIGRNIICFKTYFS